MVEATGAIWLFALVVVPFILQLYDMARGPGSPLRPLGRMTLAVPRALEEPVTSIVHITSYRTAPEEKRRPLPAIQKPLDQTGRAGSARHKSFQLAFEPERKALKIERAPFSGYMALAVLCDVIIEDGALRIEAHWSLRPVLTPLVATPLLFGIGPLIGVPWAMVELGIVVAAIYPVMFAIALLRARRVARTLLAEASVFLEDELEAIANETAQEKRRAAS